MSFFCVRLVEGTKVKSLGTLRNVTFMLNVEEKSYGEFVISGFEPGFYFGERAVRYH